MKTIVAGSRTIINYDLIKEVLDIAKPNITEVVSGRAKGVDTLGEKWALENHVILKLFPADWKGKGKAAGYLRNIDMAEYADALIAFWDGLSRGTKHMIETAEKLKLNVTVINIGGY